MTPDDIAIIANALKHHAGQWIRTFDRRYEAAIVLGQEPDRARRFLTDPGNRQEMEKLDRHARLVAELTGERRDIVYEDIAGTMANADLDLDDARSMVSMIERNTRTPEEARWMDPE